MIAYGEAIFMFLFSRIYALSKFLYKKIRENIISLDLK